MTWSATSRRDEPLLSRKHFMALFVAGGATVLPGCDLSMDPSGQKDGAEGGGAMGPEAPMLAEKVKAGELPPVRERLPENPRMIPTVGQIGRYGGTWRSPILDNALTWIRESLAYGAHLVHWDPDWKEIIPHAAESFDIIGEGREYVFNLRRETKWSDGTPLTADDVVFWRDALLANSELTPVIPNDLGDDGEPFAVEKLDDYRVKMAFREPHGLFLQYLASKDQYMILIPRHYMEQFHAEYNPDVDELVSQENAGTWTELFLRKMDPINNTELPTLAPWLATNPSNEGGVQTWVRNPYYFAVDPEGSQLPYIDEARITPFNDPEALVLSAANGEIDMYMRAEITNPTNRPVLASSARSGHYKLVDVNASDHNVMGICFNLTHKDPIKREIFQNKEFRIGLSHAINRQELIDVVFLRQGKPWQTAPRPECPFFGPVEEEMGEQYTEYDIALANEYLDRAGYADRDEEGWRLGPDASPIVVIAMTQARYPFMADSFQLIQRTWERVGIKLRIDNVAATLVGERKEANDFDCTADLGELGYIGMIRDPRWLFATGSSSYAPLWSNWFEGATPSEIPPEAMAQQIEIWRNEVFAKPMLEDQFDGIQKVIAIARDEFWTMGICLPPEAYAIVTDRFHNVPGDNQMWQAFSCPYPAASNPEQFFISD